MNWKLWRVVTSKKFNTTLTEIRRHWDILDLFEAHCLLDSFDDAEAEAAAKTET